MAANVTIILPIAVDETREPLIWAVLRKSEILIVPIFIWCSGARISVSRPLKLQRRHYPRCFVATEMFAWARHPCGQCGVSCKLCLARRSWRLRTSYWTTGRGGEQVESVSFASEDELSMIPRIEKVVGEEAFVWIHGWYVSINIAYFLVRQDVWTRILQVWVRFFLKNAYPATSWAGLLNLTSRSLPFYLLILKSPATKAHIKRWRKINRTSVSMVYAGSPNLAVFLLLGDGRGVLLGEVKKGGMAFFCMIYIWKGAGPTPYSRRVNGRAVLATCPFVNI